MAGLDLISEYKMLLLLYFRCEATKLRYVILQILDRDSAHGTACRHVRDGPGVANLEDMLAVRLCSSLTCQLLGVVLLAV